MTDFYKRVNITFNLPFSLDIPNGLYKIQTDDFLCGVFIRLKQAQDNPSGWQGNLPISDDRLGHTNYSEVLTKFVFTNPKQRLVGKDEEIYEGFTLIAINRLLDTVRWTSEKYVNHHLVRKDIPSISSKFFDDANQELAGSHFSMKSQISSTRNVMLTDEKLKELKNRLENNKKIPFEIELTLNAKDHLKFENYRMASIEIQNAVEFVISEIMTSYLKQNGKTDHEINEILRDGFKRFKDDFKKATTESITGSNEYTQWQNKCAKLRHLILHRGKQPTPQEAKDSLKAGEDFLKVLEQYRLLLRT